MSFPTLFGLIGRGYFPKELPPPFNTRSLALISRDPTKLPLPFTNPCNPSKNIRHSYLSRLNSRRGLGIVNPIDYVAISTDFIANWKTLRSIFSKSRVSITTPKYGGPPGRAFTFRNLDTIDTRKTAVRAVSRYLLRADISQFYHSIYTHSIAWALHGKKFAKQHRDNPTLFGNILDKRIRNSQDKQTVGIPIGPDTSFLIAEAILSVCDEQLRKLNINNFTRYIDDYEFGCLTLQQAEEFRNQLQELLGEFELILNPDKTKIVDLPTPLDVPCISYIRTFNLKGLDADSQKYAIISLFDSAFESLKKDSDTSIIKYLLAKLTRTSIKKQNWALYENLLLECLVSDPSTITYVLNEFAQYKVMNYPLNLDHINQVMNSLIKLHAPINHSSEVAWSLWSQIVLGLKIAGPSIKAAAHMNDSVVALLLLDAHNKKLTSTSPDFTNYQAFMDKDELYGDQWLLSYEANVKNWLPSNNTSDHVNMDTCFSFLKKSGVHFYDDHWIENNQPKKKSTFPKAPVPKVRGGDIGHY